MDKKISEFLEKIKELDYLNIKSFNPHKKEIELEISLDKIKDYPNFVKDLRYLNFSELDSGHKIKIYTLIGEGPLQNLNDIVTQLYALTLNSPVIIYPVKKIEEILRMNGPLQGDKTKGVYGPNDLSDCVWDVWVLFMQFILFVQSLCFSKIYKPLISAKTYSLRLLSE